MYTDALLLSVDMQLSNFSTVICQCNVVYVYNFSNELVSVFISAVCRMRQYFLMVVFPIPFASFIQLGVH